MTRAVSPVLGVLLLTGLTLVLAVAAAVAVVDTAPRAAVPEPVVLSASADADAGRIVLVHESGQTLDVGEIQLRIAVDGSRLAYQPPVPFFGARGFHGSPTGPFNDATDSDWELGESAGLRIAGTNRPWMAEGSTVRVEIYRDGMRIAAVETTAR